MLSREFEYILMVLMLLTAALGVYFTWDSMHISNKAEPTAYQQYKPSKDADGIGYEELCAENEDVVGWITIYDTDIDYPLVQGSSNTEYLNRNARGENSCMGSIFMDCHNSRDFSDFNTIIYGQHISGGAMLGTLSLFEDAQYFKSHRFGELYYGGKLHVFETVAFLNSVNAFDREFYTAGISEPSAHRAYIDKITGNALNMRNVILSADDRLLLISTCSRNMTQGRYVLVAKMTDILPSESAKDDNRYSDEECKSCGLWGKIRVIIRTCFDGLKRIVGVVPMWYRLCIAALSVMPVAVLAVKKKHKE